MHTALASASPPLAAAHACTFDLLDVSCLQDPASRRIIHLYALQLRCHGCQQEFTAREGNGFLSLGNARLLSCPGGCGQQHLRSATLRDWRAS
ncbi:MAG: hypothetical protein GAK31_00274 [Stenotrophomonas maltophilia]|uniref:Uncharacterized protein n=1 Tax=Stenotrophomonas maltophilia TaxID=40324 RepID=A0A7V8FJ02_STEMA|nr:MAG: hypothetical protein GAK31_00274 [Stenotrophomonas maltophilia]